MADLAERINGEFHSEMHCIFNDDNADKLILRLRVLSDADDKGGDGADHDDTFLKNIEGTLLTQVALQGVHGIKKVFIRETDRLVPDAAAAGGYASEKEWMLDTEGVNLLEVMSHPAVDATRTISNDLTEVIEVLGIEAARGALLKEVRGVIEFDGSYVNYRHLAILCDAMTTRGYFAAITRHGINRGDAAGPLAQASFEETVEILYRASAYAERDAVSGVSQAVMLGQLAPVGTGAFGLLLDEARLADAVEVQVAGGGGEGGYGGGYGGGGGAYGAMPTPGRATPGMTPSHASPSVFRSPGLWSPLVGGGAVQFSPAVGGASPAYTPGGGGGGGASPAYSPSSPAGGYGGGGGAPPGGGYGPSPTSPAWQSPASPAYAGAGGQAAAMPSAGPSPYYSPSSPAWAPGGGGGGGGGAATARVSPTSPAYSPGGGGGGAAGGGAFYSPSSPAWSPAAVDGGGGGGGAAVSPASPAWSPGGAAGGGGAAAGYNASPAYSPSSPAYSPSSPAYSPSGAAAGAAPQAYAGTSPQYSPSSPAYAPADAPPPAE